jgi:hypothetical protein
MDYFSKKLARIKNIANRSGEWRNFAQQVRARRDKLLCRLDGFPDAILVSGCQRSGSTMFARLITQSEGLTNYWFGTDDELDAALILAGIVEHRAEGRYCFQTTYLNERYPEYFEHSAYKLIWMLRNPESVAYSMLYNWSDYALNELFRAVGVEHLGGEDKDLYLKRGLKAISPIRRASYAYVGKVSQLFELVPKLGKERIMVVEYDDVVGKPQEHLVRIYDYLHVPWKGEYLNRVNRDSIGKKQQLSADERRTVREVCATTYERASEYAARYRTR